MEKLLLFTTGGATADASNVNSSEIAMYNVKDFRGAKAKNATTISIFFETSNGREIVDLGITSGKHNSVLRSISNAIVKSTQSIITIADIDNSEKIDTNITSVSLVANETLVQSLANNSRTQINPLTRNYSKLFISNNHTSDVACTLELHDGATYTRLFNAISIPANTSLILDRDEIAFDLNTYTLHATSDNASGKLTFTFIL